MAATIDFALDAKQALLEARSEDERMRMIASCSYHDEAARPRRARERARPDDGKVRF